MFGVEDVSIVTEREMFAHLMPQQVVVLDGSIVPLSAEQEKALCTFVERGGGLVCLGNAVEVYQEYPLLGEVLGPLQGRCTPPCEIIASVAHPDTYLTRRVDPSFAFFEAVYLLASIPEDAQVLWRTTWHYAPYTLAYTRSYGRGRVFLHHYRQHNRNTGTPGISTNGRPRHPLRCRCRDTRATSAGGDDRLRCYRF